MQLYKKNVFETFIKAVHHDMTVVHLTGEV